MSGWTAMRAVHSEGQADAAHQRSLEQIGAQPAPADGSRRVDGRVSR
jgi:hypothetical protein